MIPTKAPRIITITIFTTITIIFWVFFSLYQVLTNKPDKSVPKDLLQEVNPTLDATTLQVLGNRLFFEEGQVSAIPGTIEGSTPTVGSGPTSVPTSEPPSPTPERINVEESTISP